MTVYYLTLLILKALTLAFLSEMFFALSHSYIYTLLRVLSMIQCDS